MFSRVFSKENLTAIAKRLDLTDYKVLVCCVDNGQMKTGVFPLKSGVELERRIQTTITGSGDSFKCRVFVRTVPLPQARIRRASKA